MTEVHFEAYKNQVLWGLIRELEAAQEREEKAYRKRLEELASTILEHEKKQRESDAQQGQLLRMLHPDLDDDHEVDDQGTVPG